MCESFAEGARNGGRSGVGEGRTGTTVWTRDWVLQGQDGIGGFCLSGMMGKGVGRLLLHFLLTSDAPLWFLLDGRRQDGPLDWMSWSGCTISSTTVPWKKHKSGAARDKNRERKRETYRLRHRLRLSTRMGLAGADHDGGDVCSCSRNDSV